MKRPHVSLAVESTADGAIRVGGIRLTLDEANELADSIHDAIDVQENATHD